MIYSLLRMLLSLVKWLFSLALLLFLLVPVMIRMNPWLMNKMVFVNMVRWPPFIDFDKPEDFGLNHTSNFYLTHNDITLGVWHVLPEQLASQQRKTQKKFEEYLNTGHPIIIYYHGNTGTRAGWHRVQLYKKLSQMGYHIITVDYRGYGDSSGSPTEPGVCADAMFVYEWVRARAGDTPIFFWGHSLGTGITVKATKLLTELGKSPAGVVLEAPFNNAREAASRHPFSMPFRILPWFNWIFLDTLAESDIFFQSDHNIVTIKAPLMIMHAKDDYIIPYDLGHKLYSDAVKSRVGTSLQTSFIAFEAHFGYGHKHMYRAPELQHVVKKFMNDCLQQK